MIIKFILLLGWILCSCLEGCRDAFFYFYKMYSTKSDKHNMHWLFTLERAIILSAACYINSLYFTTLNTIVFTTSLIFMFSFFHNGTYYSVRHWLDKMLYPKRWFDSSTTSTSRIELGVIPRTVMMIIGAIGVMASFQIK